MTNDSRLREVALIIADDLIGICETATKVAHRTGNTFVIDRQRTASMIQGRIASLNKSNPNEHQPHAGGLESCPFCECEAILLKDHKKLGFYVACKMCDAASGTFPKDEAIAAWNTRANAETRPSGSAGSAPVACAIGQSDIKALQQLADGMGFGRTHDMLRRVILALPYDIPPTPLLRCEPGLIGWLGMDGKFSVPSGMTKEKFLALFAGEHLPIGTPVIALYASPIQGAGVSRERKFDDPTILDNWRKTTAHFGANEFLYEIANRAGNYLDADAADWMESIYYIACVAVERLGAGVSEAEIIERCAKVAEAIAQKCSDEADRKKEPAFTAVQFQIANGAIRAALAIRALTTDGRSDD